MPTPFRNIPKEFAEGRAAGATSKRSELEHGATTPLPNFLRFVILDVIFDPQIIDNVKLDYWEHTLGVSNIAHAAVAPRNSVIARRVLGPSSSPTDTTMVLYPFFPHTLAMPANPGEHIWVMFEDPAGSRNDLGYWICKITQPNFVEDVNHTHAPRSYDASFAPGTIDKFDNSSQAKYEFRNGKPGEIDGERYTIASTATLLGDEDAYKTAITESDAGQLRSLEPVPRYRKRPGEFVVEGSFNSSIVVGKDRTGVVADYLYDEEKGSIPSQPDQDSSGPGAGSIDIVAGRGQTPATMGTVVDNDLQEREVGKSADEISVNEGDPDFLNDRSRVLVTQRTNVDTNFDLVFFNQEFDGGSFPGAAHDTLPLSIQDSVDGDGAVIIKSDKIRLIARADLEMIVTGYELDDDGLKITDDNIDNWAAIVAKTTGDIVIRPATRGYIKLGGDDADKAVVCTDFPANAQDGIVTAAPIVTTMAGQLAGTKIANQGMYATKILVK